MATKTSSKTRKRTDAKRTDPTRNFSPPLYLYSVLGELLCDLEMGERLVAALFFKRQPGSRAGRSYRQFTRADGSVVRVDSPTAVIPAVEHTLASMLDDVKSIEELSLLNETDLCELQATASKRVSEWEEVLRRGGRDPLRKRLSQRTAGEIVKRELSKGEGAKAARRTAAERVGLTDESALRKWGRTPEQYAALDPRLVRGGGENL